MRRHADRDTGWRKARRRVADGSAAAASGNRLRAAISGRLRLALGLGLLVVMVGCGGILDAGRNLDAGPLAVDHHNPVIIDNDGCCDNWAGEFAVLLANTGGLTLEGIVVDASNYWTDQSANATGWNNLVAAARASGLEHLPDVTLGASSQLTVPADQKIESTVPLGTKGAHLIVDLSRQLALPEQPLVVVTGAALTDLADAYLMDRSVVDRVTVVASLGSTSSGKALMTGPNGDLDPWADFIVAQRFRYVQVTVLYDQSGDVTADDFANLPQNKLGDWIKAKQPNLSKLNTAADHVAVIAAGIPSFVTASQPSTPDPAAVYGSPQGQGPPLIPSSTGNALVVTQVDAALVRTRLWQMLQDPHIFGGS